MVVHVRAPSIGQIDQFKNYSYSVGLCIFPLKKTKQKKNLTATQKKMSI